MIAPVIMGIIAIAGFAFGRRFVQTLEGRRPSTRLEASMANYQERPASARARPGRA